MPQSASGLACAYALARANEQMWSLPQVLPQGLPRGLRGKPLPVKGGLVT